MGKTYSSNNFIYWFSKVKVKSLKVRFLKPITIKILQCSLAKTTIIWLFRYIRLARLEVITIFCIEMHEKKDIYLIFFLSNYFLIYFNFSIVIM